MRVNFRYPSVTGASTDAQIAQIKSYLHQLVEQLNNELSTLGSGGSTQNQQQGNDEAYYELRSLIANETREIKSLIDKLSTKMQSEYVTKEELQTAIAALSEPAADT